MKITRRKLLIAGGIGGGGLLLGLVGAAGYVQTFDRRAIQRDALPANSGQLISQWITVKPDGTTTLISPHTEMGQGARTGLVQILLDEMDVDPKTLLVEQAPPSHEFTHSDAAIGFLMGDIDDRSGWTKEVIEHFFGRVGQLASLQFTGGSTAIRFTGWKGIRMAAASARHMLAQAGADKLGVPLSEVTTANSKVLHKASGRELGYGELAAAAAALELPEAPSFKKKEDWKYIGKRYDRIDLPDKVFARAVYGIDVEVEGMRHAAVAPPPLAFAKVTGVENEAELEKMRGVEAVVVLDDCVAVVADNPWRAEQAARKARVTCETPEGGLLDSARVKADQRAAIAAGGLDSKFSRGDVEDALSGGDVIEVEYSVPFLAHAPMEPLNATVWEEGGKLHAASGAQDPLGARRAIADAVDRDLEDVVFHPHTMGGGFGRRAGNDKSRANWLFQAARIQAAVGGAVKMVWSREADVRMCAYRPNDVVKMRGKLGSDGKPVVWHAQSYGPLMVVPEATPVYDIPNVAVDTVSGDLVLPTAPWRSVDASIHAFFVESFIDELAKAAGEDPVAYRMSLLGKHERHKRVLETVARMAGWESGPSVEGGALGVALFESFGSIVGQIAQVSIHEGRPKVHDVWCAIDCGLAVNPNSVEAQMQGGIVFGLTAALYGEITLEEGQIVQSNFHDYRMIRFGDAPRIEVEILSTPDVPLGGAGEPGTPPIAPAVANALAVLRPRDRDLPLTPLMPAESKA